MFTCQIVYFHFFVETLQLKSWHELKGAYKVGEKKGFNNESFFLSESYLPAYQSNEIKTFLIMCTSSNQQLLFLLQYPLYLEEFVGL